MMPNPPTTPPPPPPPTTPPIQWPTATQPPPRRRRLAVVGGVAAVAVLGGSAAFIATRGEGSSTTADTTVETTVDTVDDPSDDTVVAAPETVETIPVVASTVESVPVATATPVTNLPIAIPDGALDLGYGVYFPATDGLQFSGDGPYTAAYDDRDSELIMQVLNRAAGEDPNVLIQEYVDTFDPDFDPIAYNLIVSYEPGFQGYPNMRYSELPYSIFQAEGDANISGTVWIIQRNDGLTFLGDSWGSDVSDGRADTSLDAMLASLAAAPAVGETAAWFETTSILPTTVHETVAMPFECACRLALPPGYVVADTGVDDVSVENDSVRVTIARLTGLQRIDDATLAAVQYAQARYDITDMDTPVDGTANPTLANRRMVWAGTAGGVEVYGDVYVSFDQHTGSAIVVLSAVWPNAVNQSNEIGFIVDNVAWRQPYIL